MSSLKFEKIEYLIIINAVCTEAPELVELNLCSYGVSKKQVSTESSFYIRPSNFSFSSEFLKENKINLTDLEVAENLPDVVEKVNLFLQENFVDKSLAFAFVCRNEGVLRRIQEEFANKKIAAFLNIENHFNLMKEFKSFYKVDKINQREDFDLDDMLQFLTLKQTESNIPSLKDLNSMVRIVNRMIKDGHEFRLPDKELQLLPTDNIQAYNKIPRETEHSFKRFYLKFKNFPIYFDKQDIKDILYQFKVNDEDISIAFDIFGNKTGDVYLIRYNESEYKEILGTFKFYAYGNTLLDVVEANSEEFNSSTKEVVGAKLKFIKMSNIPYSANEETIRNFFKGYGIAEHGIKMNRYRKGSFTGEAVICFLNNEEAETALLKESERMLMNQNITLIPSNLSEFESFASSSSVFNVMKVLSEYVTPEVVPRSLFLNNLPLDFRNEDITKRLSMFNITQTDLILEEKFIHRYGCLIVKFYNEDDAEYAKYSLTKQPLVWNERSKELYVENLLTLVNKANE